MAHHRTATRRQRLLDWILRRRKAAHAHRGMTATAIVYDEVDHWQTPDEWARQHYGRGAH